MTYASGMLLHFVGAGGAGMTALASLLLDRGVRISGSDQCESDGTVLLRSRGAAMVIGPHSASNVPEDAGLVVFSAAVPEGNPERVRARELEIPSLVYAEALGRAMEGSVGIAVAGTHGKTTTSALVAVALKRAGLDPSFVIGGEAPDLGASGVGGSGRHFVVEACEFNRSFLRLCFSIAAVINVEPDHLDFFGSVENMRQAYRAFVSRLPEDGRLVAPVAALESLGSDLLPRARITTVSLREPADARAHDLRLEQGRARFSVAGAFTTAEIRCAVPGLHFAEDALVAAALLDAAGLDGDAIAEGISSFRGVKRRLELLLDDEVTLFSDYAHHPTELSAVHDAIRAAYPDRRLLVLFEPHQASRTRFFMDGFGEALARFDRVLVPDIFVTRDSESDRKAVSSTDLVQAVSARGGSARYVGDLDRAKVAVLDEQRPGDVILLLGAGPIDRLSDELQAALSRTH